MMKALRGNLAILALAPALVMLALGLAVLRPAQARDAFVKAGLIGAGAAAPLPGLAVAAATNPAPEEDMPAPAQKPHAFACKIMLCTGLMGFPVQEPPLRTCVSAGTLPRGPALVPEEAMTRRDVPPPKPRSSNFS